MRGRTLIGSDAIQQRVAEMGLEISSDLKGHDVILLCVLKGAIFFAADLARALSIEVALDFIQISSYGDRKSSSGVVTILKEPQLDMTGKAVLIVEDIVDSGLSMREVYRYIQSRGATLVKVATFLDKSEARKVPFVADYIGYSIEDHFVIGYGLDYAEKYRNLNEVCFLGE